MHLIVRYGCTCRPDAERSCHAWAWLSARLSVVLADKCWWRGVTSKRIVEDMITGDRDDPKVGVAVKLGKISEKEHGLGGSALPR